MLYQGGRLDGCSAAASSAALCLSSGAGVWGEGVRTPACCDGGCSGGRGCSGDAFFLPAGCSGSWNKTFNGWLTTTPGMSTGPPPPESGEGSVGGCPKAAAHASSTAADM